MNLSAAALRREIEMLHKHAATENQKADAAIRARQTKIGRHHRRRADAYLMAASRWAAIAAKLEFLHPERDAAAPVAVPRASIRKSSYP